MGNLSVKKVAGWSLMLGPIIGLIGYFIQSFVVQEGGDPTSAAVVPLINSQAGLTFIAGIIVMIGLMMMLNGVKHLASNMTDGPGTLSGYVITLVSIGIIGWIVTIAGNWTIAGLDFGTAEAANAGPVFALMQGINAMATILFGLGFLILACCISQGDVHNKIFAYIATATAAVIVVVQILSSANVITDGQLASQIGSICFIIFTLWAITLGRKILSD